MGFLRITHIIFHTTLTLLFFSQTLFTRKENFNIKYKQQRHDR